MLLCLVSYRAAMAARKVKRELLLLPARERQKVDSLSVCLDARLPAEAVRELRDLFVGQSDDSVLAGSSTGDPEAAFFIRVSRRPAHVTFEFRPGFESPFPRVSKSRARRVIELVDSGALTLRHVRLSVALAGQEHGFEAIPSLQLPSFGKLDFAAVEYVSPKPPGGAKSGKATFRFSAKRLELHVRAEYDLRVPSVREGVQLALEKGLSLK